MRHSPLRLALATETRDEDLCTPRSLVSVRVLRARGRWKRTVVLVDKVEATVVRDEGGDLLAVLDELDTDTLADGRVGLLGLDTDLLEHDALGVRRTTGRRRAVRGAERALLVVVVGPAVVAAVVTELAAGEQTTRLAGSCWENSRFPRGTPESAFSVVPIASNVLCLYGRLLPAASLCPCELPRLRLAARSGGVTAALVPLASQCSPCTRSCPS